MIYKMKPAWEVFDFISHYFFLIVVFSVLLFGIYFAVTLVWALLLTVYLIQNFFTLKKHYRWRKISFEEWKKDLPKTQSDFEERQ